MRYIVYFIINGIRYGKAFHGEEAAIDYRTMHEEMGRTAWIADL